MIPPFCFLDLGASTTPRVCEGSPYPATKTKG